MKVHGSCNIRNWNETTFSWFIHIPTTTTLLVFLSRDFQEEEAEKEEEDKEEHRKNRRGKKVKIHKTIKLKWKRPLSLYGHCYTIYVYITWWFSQEENRHSEFPAALLVPIWTRRCTWLPRAIARILWLWTCDFLILCNVPALYMSMFNKGNYC